MISKKRARFHSLSGFYGVAAGEGCPGLGGSWLWGRTTDVGSVQPEKEEPARARTSGQDRPCEGARYLAKNFPHLRSLGLDTVSLASMQHPEEALEAHRILLRGEGRGFLIIEDMNLDGALSRLRSVIALPLFIEEVDSSPCAVMGICD